TSAANKEFAESFALEQGDDFKFYINVIRANLLPILLIFTVAVLCTFTYLYFAKNIYRSTTVLKIDNPKGSILENPFGEMGDYRTERYILNQMEVLKSFYIRDVSATEILDSLKHLTDFTDFAFLASKSKDGKVSFISQENLRKSLIGIIGVSQKKGLDALEISVESPSFREAQLITLTYTNTYVAYLKDLSRQDITAVKQFLATEKDKKFNELNTAEAKLEDFQKRTGLLILDAQATNLVAIISQYDAQKKAADIELRASENGLNTLKNELGKIDPSMNDFIQGQVSKSYIEEFQRQIAEYEVKRDIENSTIKDPAVKEKLVNDANERINELRRNLRDKVSQLSAGILANTPDEKKDLSKRILDGTIQTQSLSSKTSSLDSYLKKYEGDFAKLPAESIELAKLEREATSAEKLYLILEEKYQEATINERARIANAVLLDPGIEDFGPVKPKKNIILLSGLIIGLSLGLGFAFTRNFLDKTIKTPDQIENRGMSVLSWIPNIEGMTDKSVVGSEFMVALKPKSPIAESFKALRTRVEFSKLESEPIKTILITSSIPSEGKTVVALNLAGTFAQANKRVLLVDCDLRKPRVHSALGTDRYPGLSDYLFKNVAFEDIVKKTQQENMWFIPSGTIPPNPSELLGSVQMKNFLAAMKEQYDIIVLDSPPFITVTDAEILFNMTDGTILVAQANKTPFDAFIKSYVRLSSINPHNLLGAVLNNFNFKASYGYYYNYYYYYQNQKPEEKHKA
ncbi:MAG: polysaccharide biosynthesis tyrosine autokinase, partial [Ignavibacteria bacterium]|nr:polysaccharide biosynthesis tyrosine autokinase [Ignavibacteria bacterium]